MKIRKKELTKNQKTFIKAFVCTISAIMLIAIGYFTAGYFFGGI